MLRTNNQGFQEVEGRTIIEEKEKSLNEAAKEAVNDIDAANGLWSDGTAKLANSISSNAVDHQWVKVESLIIEMANESKSGKGQDQTSFCEG